MLSLRVIDPEANIHSEFLLCCGFSNGQSPKAKRGQNLAPLGLCDYSQRAPILRASKVATAWTTPTATATRRRLNISIGMTVVLPGITRSTLIHDGKL